MASLYSIRAQFALAAQARFFSLRTWRQERKLTQAQLAADLGVTRQTLLAWEKGTPGRETVLALAMLEQAPHLRGAEVERAFDYKAWRARLDWTQDSAAKELEITRQTFLEREGSGAITRVSVLAAMALEAMPETRLWVKAPPRVTVAAAKL